MKDKKIIYIHTLEVPQCAVGGCATTLSIITTIYKYKSFFGCEKTKIGQHIPFIGKPFWDDEYNTNRVLQVLSDNERNKAKVWLETHNK